MSETEIVQVVPPAFGSLVSSTLVDAARAFASDAKAPRTRKAYRCGWLSFTAWCDAHGLQAMPAAPETLALYVTARAESGKKAATITLDVASVSAAHRTAGHPSPATAETVRAVMQGIRRNIGTAQRRVSALTPEQLHTIVAALPEGLIGLRDRALLVVGFGGGFRRSELVALDRSDLMFTADGLELTIRRSKTDQEGAGRKLGIPFGAHRQTCGVRTMQEWLAASGITEGAVWRPITRHGALGSERLADRAVALVLKRCLARVGIDPTSFAGHSLRSGLVTAAFKAGKSEATIMAQTGHKSAEVMRRYRRETDLFAANAAGGIGL